MRPIGGKGVWLAGAVALTLAAGAAGFGLGRLQMKRPAPSKVAPGQGRRVLYWYDPMVPQQHFDHPGLSPMGMQMVPQYADQASSGAGEGGVRIDPRAAENLGMRLASVTRGTLSDSFDAAGVIDFNQRDVAIVQSRAAGFVQRVYARAPGDVVRAGAPLADLLVPSWAGAQMEFLAVRRTGDTQLTAAARARLRLLGMPETLIARVQRSGRPNSIVTIRTPVGGAIQTLDVRQGMTVNAGQSLAQVTSLATVWLNASVPEAQAPLVRLGQPARAELTAFPGRTFFGRVIAVLPTAQTQSRTIETRIELPNPGGELRPGMFATVHFGAALQPALLVPSEAVIRTGERNIVMLAEPGGRFQPVEVRIGRSAQGQTEILAGLSEGQQVVASGQFLIDSEASLEGLQVRPLREPPVQGPALPSEQVKPPAASTQPLFQTRGRIEALSPGLITISHEAVPAAGWPAMTMTFALDPPTLANGLKVGERIAFGFEQRPSGPVVRRVTPLRSAR